GYDTVLFLFKLPTAMTTLKKWLGTISLSDEQNIKAPILDVPVVYEGQDLGIVAKKTGHRVDEVIEMHSSPIYTVRMVGFSPGFPYLDGLDPRLQIPRKESPRKRIEPGSVAIGGPHAGVYTVASPGGWHLLGRTELKLFQPKAAAGLSPAPKEVFLLSPGDRLRFLPTT
ncbi:MAG: 5-oxoprolinase subunit B family protein, partial [Opitutales bacterium]